MSRPLKPLAFAAALSALAGAAAHAQPVGLKGIAVDTAGDRLVQSETVSYADLDLSRAEGVKTLMRRIDGAAKDVCGPEPDIREWRSPYQACVKSAVDQALADVNRASEANRLAMAAQRRRGG
jgi:UrcA family protein